jgi:hypothetical protein
MPGAGRPFTKETSARARNKQRSHHARRPLPPGASPGAGVGAGPGTPPTRPEQVVEVAQASVLTGAVRQVPPGCSYRIKRASPAWCRGWLEDVDPNAISAAGGIYRYLGDTWGGSRYCVETLDDRNEPTGLVAWFDVVGPPRSWGVEVAAPCAVRAELPPPYPAQPQLAPPSSPQLEQLVGAVGQLARTQAELAARLDQLRPPSPPVPPPAAAAPTSSSAGTRLGDAVAEVKETLAAVRDLADSVEALRPPAPDAPPPTDDGRLSPFAKRTVERLLDRAVDSMPIGGAQPAASGGNGNGGRQPPPSPADQVLDAESIPCRS